MFRWLLLVLVLIAAGLGLALGVLNPQPVGIDLALVQFSAPLGAALAAVLALGVVCGLLIALVLFALPAWLRSRGRGRTSLPDA